MARAFASFFVLPIVAAGLICVAAWGEIAPPLETVRDPGTGVIALDGPWQFHTGDDLSFAAPSLDDSTGHNGWEQIAVKSGAPDQLALLVPRVESIYEIYWNGVRIDGYSKMPPYPSWSYDDPGSLNKNAQWKIAKNEAPRDRAIPRRLINHCVICEPSLPERRPGCTLPPSPARNRP